MVLNRVAELRALDVLVVAKLVVSPCSNVVYEDLAVSLGISKGAAHGSVKRLIDARLLGHSLRIMGRHVAEMLAFGVRYFLPSDLGPEAGGMATSFGVPPLLESFGPRDDAPVWPSTLGDRRGPSVVPIYETVPFAASQDDELYRLLALVDAVRIGRARELGLAREAIAKRFGVSEW